jgi:parallel beta-helix repeat protein
VVGGGGGRIVGNRITKNSGHAIVLGGAGEVVLEDNELKDNRRPQVRRSAQ